YDDQHVSLDFEADIAKKTCRVQRLDRGGSFFVVDAVANLDRQVIKHRARVRTLHAFDSDILDGEGLERERWDAPADGGECKEHSRKRPPPDARMRLRRSRVVAGVRANAKGH